MIRFSNGHELTFCNGSGALAFDGCGWFWEWPLRWAGILDPKAFTVVAKTLTLNPTKGNLSLWHPWTCVRCISDKHGRKGLVNSVGLTNPGLEYWIKHHYPVAIKKGYKIAVSVKPNNAQEAEIMANMLSGLKLAYVEVNISCPNVEHINYDVQNILRALKHSGHPIVLKLSADQVTQEFIAASEQFVEAYHAINTIPWDQIFSGQKSPIEKYPHGLKGGVSGDFINLRALFCVRKLSGWTKKPIIGGGGIFKVEDVHNFMHNGASAFSIGTCFALRPWRPNKIVQDFATKTPCPITDKQLLV